jgi:hypothetical protein
VPFGDGSRAARLQTYATWYVSVLACILRNVNTWPQFANFGRAGKYGLGLRSLLLWCLGSSSSTGANDAEGRSTRSSRREIAAATRTGTDSTSRDVRVAELDVDETDERIIIIFIRAARSSLRPSFFVFL